MPFWVTLSKKLIVSTDPLLGTQKNWKRISSCFWYSKYTNGSGGMLKCTESTWIHKKCHEKSQDFWRIMVCDTERKNWSAGTEVTVGSDSAFMKHSNVSVRARPPRHQRVLHPHWRQLLDHLWQNMHEKTRKCLIPESEGLFLKGRWPTSFKSWINFGYVMLLQGY